MKSPEERIRELINLTKALRAEGGCPWDRKQTFLSLRNYIIEEAYEVVDAISRNDIGNLRIDLMARYAKAWDSTKSPSTP